MENRPSLDGLRAIAVGGVLLFHLSEKILPGAWTGVDIFFVLSGFLITTNLVDELNSSNTINIRNFYMRRMIRLFPALFVLLCVVALIGIAFTAIRPTIYTELLLVITQTMNFARAFNLVTTVFLAHTWSLSIEQQFYLLWPIFIVYIYKTKPISIIISIIALITAWKLYLISCGVSVARTYNGFDTHLDTILLGSLLSFVRPTEWQLKLSMIFAWVGITGLAVIYITLHFHTAFAQAFGSTLAALFTAPLLLISHTQHILSRGLSHPLLVGVGRLSYGLYLWHYPIYIFAFMFLPRTFFPLLIPAAFGTAILSHVLVEKPARKYRRLFPGPSIAKSPA
jgi:peptidoglycan/LPS O-acetylase OafA/YrhL